MFKAFVDRSRDRADIEEMLGAGTIEVDRAFGVLVRHLGADDPRVRRLAEPVTPGAGSPSAAVG